MQKTKILYLITKSNFGGAQKYVYELATSLDKELFDVSVALGGDGVLKEKLEKDGIKVIKIPDLNNKVGIFKEIGVIHFLIKLFKEIKPDIVHLNSSKIGFLGSISARLSGIPKIIFTAHGWEFNNDRSKIEKIFFKFLSWITVILTHKTIAVSEAIRKDLIGCPFVYNKFEVIWNGVKPIEFFEKEEAKNELQKLIYARLPQNTTRLPEPHHRLPEFISGSRRESEPSSDRRSVMNGLDLNKKWIGTLAELHHVKGLDVLIDSAKIILKSESETETEIEIEKEKEKNKNIQFVVIGDGQLKNKLQKQIDQSGLSDNFILMGYVDNASKYLKAFDLFVLSSRSEALSLAILEAGLAELPVVATRVGGIPEIITNKESGLPPFGLPGQNLPNTQLSQNLSPARLPGLRAGVQRTDFGLLVEKENKEELAEAILEMLEDENPFDSAQGKMAGNLNKRISEKFGYGGMVEKTVSIYSN